MFGRFFSSSDIDLIFFFFPSESAQEHISRCLICFFFFSENSSFVKKALHSLQTQSDIPNVFGCPEHQKERSARLRLGPDLTTLR